MEGETLKPGELILRKPNILIRCFSEMQGVKREFFNHLIYKSQKQFSENIIHTSTIQELKASLEHKTNDYEFIKKHLFMMSKANISWEKAGEDKYTKHHEGFINVFEFLVIEKKTVIKWRYTPIIREMASLYKEYTSFELEVLRLFESQYALALFEYCMSYSGVGQTGTKKLEHFRALIGVDDNKYPEFKHLNNLVIKKTQRDLKKRLDFEVLIKTKKAGRTITATECHIKKNEKQIEEPIITMLRKIGGNSKTIQALRKQFSDELIQSTLNTLQFPDTVKYKMAYLKRILTHKTTKISPTKSLKIQPTSLTIDNQNKQLSAEEKQAFRLSHWKKLDKVQKLKLFEDAKNRNLPFLKHIELKAIELANVLLQDFTFTTEFKWMFDVLFP